MPKKNYAKQFNRLQSNFDTTLFLFEKYELIINDYYETKEYGEFDEQKRLIKREYEIKHYNRLLCSCIYNDYKNIEILSDAKGNMYHEKKGFKSIYNTLDRLFRKKVKFPGKTMTIKDFVWRNRLIMAHSENTNEEVIYINMYSSMITGNLYNYLRDILDCEKKLIKKIEIDIGEDSIRQSKNDYKSKEIVINNYFFDLNDRILIVCQKLKDSEMKSEDYKSLINKLNILKNKLFQLELLDKNSDSINKLNSLHNYLELLVNKYSYIAVSNTQNAHKERKLLESIFTHNSFVINNYLVELSEMIDKLLKDINNNSEEMVFNLKDHSADFNEYTIP